MTYFTADKTDERCMLAVVTGARELTVRPRFPAVQLYDKVKPADLKKE